jgi:ribosomal protein S3
MGQKINPIAFRLGIIRGWESNWYGGKNFADKLAEDERIRKYLFVRIPRGGMSKIVIERTIKRIIITIHTAKPGIVIGKGGAEVDKIKEELKKITKKDVQINIVEIKRPELDAKLVAETICQQIEGRVSYKRAVKQALGFSSEKDKAAAEKSFDEVNAKAKTDQSANKAKWMDRAKTYSYKGEFVINPQTRELNWKGKSEAPSTGGSSGFGTAQG